MKSKVTVPPRFIQLVTALFLIVVVTLIILSVANYPVQWRSEVDAERYRSLEVIAQAYDLYERDHDGELPYIPDVPSVISNTSQCSGYCAALDAELPCYDVSGFFVPQYLREIPLDPLVTSDTNSGYFVFQSEGILHVAACNHYFGDVLEITR